MALISASEGRGFFPLFEYVCVPPFVEVSATRGLATSRIPTCSTRGSASRLAASTLVAPPNPVARGRQTVGRFTRLGADHAREIITLWEAAKVLGASTTSARCRSTTCTITRRSGGRAARQEVLATALTPDIIEVYGPTPSVHQGRLTTVSQVIRKPKKKVKLEDAASCQSSEPSIRSAIQHKLWKPRDLPQNLEASRSKPDPAPLRI